MYRDSLQFPSRSRQRQLFILFLICYAIAYEASNCECEQGVAVSPSLLLLKHMQVILHDDFFARETTNCMNQTFSQQLKTI